MLLSSALITSKKDTQHWTSSSSLWVLKPNLVGPRPEQDPSQCWLRCICCSWLRGQLACLQSLEAGPGQHQCRRRWPWNPSSVACRWIHQPSCEWLLFVWSSQTSLVHQSWKQPWGSGQQNLCLWHSQLHIGMHPQNEFHGKEAQSLLPISRKLCNWTSPGGQNLKTKSQRIWTPRQARSPNEPFSSWPSRLRPTCLQAWIQKNQVSTSSAVSEASKYFALHILWISSQSVCKTEGHPLPRQLSFRFKIMPVGIWSTEIPVFVLFFIILPSYGLLGFIVIDAGIILRSERLLVFFSLSSSRQKTSENILTMFNIL